jgi:hypothetical protein
VGVDDTSVPELLRAELRLGRLEPFTLFGAVGACGLLSSVESSDDGAAIVDTFCGVAL